MPNTRTNGTVLLIEDEDILRVSTAKMLRKEGLTVIDVGNGDAAVNLLRDHEKEINVVLLDMTIPGTPSGAVLAEAGRLRPDAKLLLTSAYSQEMVGPAAGAKQVVGFIRKPFQFRDLLTAIRRALSA
jgi:DNA-binding NtrC family response regulator